VVAAALALVLAVVGFVGLQYERLTTGVTRSGAIPAATSGPSTPEPTLQRPTNILLIGLDSRLDENGRPLPQQAYDALHAGNAGDGGQNGNVLILLHLPAAGRATAISIPRDDYVKLPGCPDGVCRSKIKEAYGLAYARAAARTAGSPVTDPAAREQQLRDAGRRAEIAAVQAFLGVPVDHFVEVTMAAFLQVAQVVQPITVCLNEDTQDSYSGASFHRGVQQVDAAQAVAFVRQRRDTVDPGLAFTDLDRDRRQQAFIASLLHQLRQAGTLANPVKMADLVSVADQNIAVDDGLDLVQLARQAPSLTSRGITFYTLPVDHFARTAAGADINVVDVSRIRQTVRALLAPTAPSSTSTASPSTSPTPAAVDATGTGANAPAPTQLSVLDAGGIPCVK
jgi:LCP family protein required for cell wall assembly